MFGYISWGEGIWQQLLSSETKKPETEVFPSSIVISFHLLWTLTSCFRDDVVMFCEGTAHTSKENKHYSCFLLSVTLDFSFISSCSSFECVWCWFWSCFSGYICLYAQTVKPHQQAISSRGGIVVVASGHMCGFWCFPLIVLLSLWLFPVNNVKFHSCIFLL